MYISILLNEFIINNIFFTEPTKNTVIDDSIFTRIIYSTSEININGCFFIFDIKENINDIVKLLEKIELEILDLYKFNTNCQKNKTIKVKDVLFKNRNNLQNELIIKISGIWEDNSNFGLTFKFLNNI